MKKILLFSFCILSLTLSAQTYIRKTLVVKNHTTNFRTKLYDNTLVIDSTTNLLYLFPTGAESTDKLDSITDKQIIRCDTTSLSNRISSVLVTDTILLDSSDIKHLYSNPVTILAAPGTGYINDIISLVVYYDYTGAQYTGDSSITVYYTGLGALGLLGNAIDGGVDKMNKMAFASAPALGKNLALLLKSTTSDPVGPTAVGTLRVYITYRKQKTY